MNRHRLFFVPIALAAASLLAGCWGSEKSTSLGVGTSTTPAKVGSEQCTNTCHAATVDILGHPIAATWTASVHRTDGNVQCEDCHGGGGNHWGAGPIPYPNPSAASCAVLACHGTITPETLGFDNTKHANANLTPDAMFSQISTSPFNLGLHIEECSRCHNPNQRFEFDSSGAMVKPSLIALPNPEVTCGSCHDGHDTVTVTTTVKQRANAEVHYPIFRNYLVDNATGAQVDNTLGTQMNLTDLNLIFQPNGAVKSNGTVDNSSVVGKNNELHIERLCAACHTRGTYLNSGGATHQLDIYTQWTQSGHGDRNAPAFAEFSANPPAYTNANTGLPFDLGSHQSSYPIDMALATFVTAGPATTSANAGNNNYACFKCHNGLASIAYQDNVQGTGSAPVIFGDEPETCLTCHNPHTDVTGNTKNTRKPLVMTEYTVRGGYSSSAVTAVGTLVGNVFLDNQAVPSGTGNATICVFCHQGRESGFTLFKIKLAAGKSATGNYFNQHYLGTGAMLWGHNGYEYLDNSTGTRQAKLYGAVAQHQTTNCYGCHMAAGKNANGTDNGSVGGHTWKIVSDDDVLVNSATCNAAACHNGRVPTTNAAGQLDNFSDNVVATVADYDQNGVVEGVPVEIAGLENNIISLLFARGIEYDDTAYPYFFKRGLAHVSANAFTAWGGDNVVCLKAAFNLNFAIKGLPSGPSQIGQPNTSAAVHNYRYIIQLLMDSYEDLYNNTPGASGLGLPTPAAMLANRPTGTRATVNYNPQAGGGYDPLQ